MTDNSSAVVAPLSGPTQLSNIDILLVAGGTWPGLPQVDRCAYASARCCTGSACSTDVLPLPWTTSGDGVDVQHTGSERGTYRHTASFVRLPGTVELYKIPVPLYR